MEQEVIDEIVRKYDEAIEKNIINGDYENLYEDSDDSDDNKGFTNP